MSGAFVLSVGRSGSTLLSRMMQEHPVICSISEYWTSLFMGSFGDPSWSGPAYWDALAKPPGWYVNFARKAKKSGQVPPELVYDEGKGRFCLAQCPPILTMTLPVLTDDPDGLFDELAGTVPSWETRPVTAHSAALFELLAHRFDRGLWVERSGLSYWHVPDLHHGFPDAKYVHLIRDGREVLLSMMNMRLFDPAVRTTWFLSMTGRDHLRRRLFFSQRKLGRQLLSGFNSAERVITGQHRRDRPYSLPDDMSFHDRVKVYARFWANTTELGLEAIGKLPASRVHTLRYEELVEYPREVLGAMIAFLLPGEDHGRWLDTVVPMVSRRPGRWPSLEPEVAADVEPIIGPTNAKLGYT